MIYKIARTLLCIKPDGSEFGEYVTSFDFHTHLCG